MAAAPINPSDIAFLQGSYGIHKTPPLVPGIEGTGTVVAAGKGFIARRLQGRRVACSGLTSGDGTWAQYVAVEATRCLPISARIADEQAACMFVNPWTAIALIEIARRGRYPAIVLTAGASQLSRMILRLARKRGIVTLHVVRSSEQVQVLAALGAEYVLNSNEPSFAARLKEECKRRGAKIAFDAVGGDLTGLLARVMPAGSRVIVYGGLANKPSLVGVGDLIFKGTDIEGFWLSRWLSAKNLFQLLRLGRQVQRLLDSDLKTEIRERLPLSEIRRALELATTNTTGGKILLLPQG